MESYPSRRRRRAATTPYIFWVSRITILLLFLLIAGIVGLGFLFVWYSRDLPTPGKLISAQLAQSTRIYDRNGEQLYSVYKTQNRIYVKISDIPKDLQHATIAIEDRNFYKNPGFSTTGYLRAFRDL